LASPEFHTFPIYSSLLEQTHGEHWLAVGDAAATYDPIASQGLYKALSDGVSAGRVLAAVLQGQKQELEQYDAGIKERYARYFEQRCSWYGQERRWTGADFWRNRV
jgi:flavin-dependent dehydrogenase